MLLNYTSGTTGFSKGVMLTGNNLAGNVTFGIRTELLKKGDKVLSFLPLAHAYGCAFDFLTATAVGTHVTLLGKIPSPKIIMKAFEEVKPNLIITVPLVIEKIYKNIIQPLINKKGMKWAPPAGYVQHLQHGRGHERGCPRSPGREGTGNSHRPGRGCLCDWHHYPG